MSDDATIFIGRQQGDGAGGMRNSRVIKERETFDSAYPSIKGYDYYRKERNSCLQKKKKIRDFPSRRKDSPSLTHFCSDFFLPAYYFARNRETIKLFWNSSLRLMPDDYF